MIDTLAYAKRLREAGITQEQAEAHAEAAREFMTAELATKSDILAAKTELLAVLEQEIAAIKRDGASAEEGPSLKQHSAGRRLDVVDVKEAIASCGQRIELKIDILALRLTVRFGIMITAWIVVLGVIIKFSH
jgi:hypothetical protein